MPYLCGIDLGTTYSSISWYDEDNNRVDTIDLESADGSKLLRSVVYYPGNGQPAVVGTTAWNAYRQYPDQVVVGIKRSMGTAFTLEIDGKQLTPPEISAEILKTLVNDAQAFLGDEIKAVVITVPAYFGDNERAATLEAGKLAGLNVLSLLPEPHAAALAYAVEKVTSIIDRYLLVYDLGGGTFDVTLIHATTTKDADGKTNLDIETLCKDGNAALGGLDWDRALAAIVTEKIQEAYGIDVSEDPRNEPILMDNCEKAKRDLSRTSPVAIIGDMAGHQVNVSVAEFEDRTHDLVMSAEMLLQQVIEDAGKNHGISPDQIEVMLCGGSSKMPMVRKSIEGVTGKAPMQYRNPDLLVTIGAAYRAYLLESGNSIPVPGKKDEELVLAPTGLTDASFYSIGIEVFRPDGKGGFGRFNAVVLPKGIIFGKEITKEFRTAEDGSTEILLVLYKGETDNIDDCERLMDFTIAGLPAGRPRGQLVRVTLGYDPSGIVRGKAIDVSSGVECEIVIDRSKESLPL
jgi:molecular chaperone DnaK